MMEMQSAEAVNDADDRGSQDENNIGKWLWRLCIEELQLG